MEEESENESQRQIQNPLMHDALPSENLLIETIIKLGHATNDTKTMLNAATSLAHMTELLHCNETVASDEAMSFMMNMLRDTKNVKNHR